MVCKLLQNLFFLLQPATNILYHSTVVLLVHGLLIYLHPLLESMYDQFHPYETYKCSYFHHVWLPYHITKVYLAICDIHPSALHHTPLYLCICQSATPLHTIHLLAFDVPFEAMTPCKVYGVSLPSTSISPQLH